MQACKAYSLLGTSKKDAYPPSEAMSLWSALVDTGAKYLAVSGVSCCSNFRMASLVEKTNTFCVRWLEVVLPTPELPVARVS